MEKIELVCKGKRGIEKCKEAKEKKENSCKIYKETGIGLQGPIVGIKRVCLINKPRDLLLNW